MKTKFILFAIFSLILTFSPTTNNAWAAFTFDEIKMVGTPLSTLEQEYFGLDETPWLYLKLPESPFSGALADLNITLSAWESPADAVYTFSGGVSLDRENWLTAPNWDAIKTQGRWDVDAMYLGLAGAGCGHTSFTVTPEPLAMTLFLIGGAPIAAGIYQKKRKI